jgi:outer membrane autotransporter protein
VLKTRDCVGGRFVSSVGGPAACRILPRCEASTLGFGSSAELEKSILHLPALAGAEDRGGLKARAGKQAGARAEKRGVVGLARRGLIVIALLAQLSMQTAARVPLTYVGIGNVEAKRAEFNKALRVTDFGEDDLWNITGGPKILRNGYSISPIMDGRTLRVYPYSYLQAPSLKGQENGYPIIEGLDLADNRTQRGLRFKFDKPISAFGLEIGAIVGPLTFYLFLDGLFSYRLTVDYPNAVPSDIETVEIGSYIKVNRGCLFFGFIAYEGVTFSDILIQHTVPSTDTFPVFGGTIRYGRLSWADIVLDVPLLAVTALSKPARRPIFDSLKDSKLTVAVNQALGKAMNASAMADVTSDFLGRTLAVARTAGGSGSVKSGAGPSAMAPGMLAQAVAAGDLGQLIGMTGHRAQMISQPRAKNSPLQTVMAGIASASGQGIHHSGDGVTVWMQPLGQYARIKGRTGLEAWGGGVIGGAMMDVRPQLGLGFVGGYMANQMKPRDADAKAAGLKADSHRMTHTGLLGPSLRFTQSQDGTGLAVDQLVLGSFGRVHDKRDLPFIGMAAKSRFNTWGVTSSTEASYGFAINKNLLVSPVAVFDASYSHEADHRDKGADAFDLRFGRVRSTTLSQQGGVRVKYSWDRADQSQMAAEVTATCLTTQPLDRKKQLKRDFIIDSSPFFEAVGGKNTVRANLQAGLTYRTPKGWTFGAAGSAQLGKNHTSASAMLTAGCTF